MYKDERKSTFTFARPPAFRETSVSRHNRASITPQYMYSIPQYLNIPFNPIVLRCSERVSEGPMTRLTLVFFQQPVERCDSNTLHEFGILMYSKCSCITHVLLMYYLCAAMFRGVSEAPMIPPRNASLSDSYVSDTCFISRRGVIQILYMSLEYLTYLGIMEPQLHLNTVVL